jgi:peroxiredoxin
MLGVGEKAPAFTAQSTDGEVQLAGLLSQGPLVLYFFPKAFTSG